MELLLAALCDRTHFTECVKLHILVCQLRGLRTPELEGVHDEQMGHFVFKALIGNGTTIFLHGKRTSLKCSDAKLKLSVF